MKKEGMLYKKIDGNKVVCNLCSHKCNIKESQYGLCKVRQNIDGCLYTLVYGNLIATQVDPIEKKPFYHFLPGTKSLSIATPGCNFRCSFCQNWQISQFEKNQLKTSSKNYFKPEKIVEKALDLDCISISYTYTEPTIFFEYAYDVCKIAKDHSIKNTFVTNGYMSKKALEKISPYLDAANVDLKSFREEFYNNMCKARLKPVLDTIKKMKELGIWVEVTTLIVPKENDSDEELNDIADFISTVGKEIPWHISRFHPDYKYNNSKPTPIKTLEKAYKIGKKHGLKYVYLGNVSFDNTTLCRRCNKDLIRRNYVGTEQNNIKNGKCKYCGKTIEGVWS